MAGPGGVLPEQGIPHADLLARLDALAAGDADWRGNRVFSLVYRHSEAHDAFLKEAHARFSSANGLNPMAFRSLKRLEADVVRMTAGLFHGGADTVGTLTSGGTESILLAVLAYREHARRHRPWILRPEIVVPASAHAAFYKAGHLFGVRIVKAPLGPDLRADVAAVRRRIGTQTVAIVGSAPCYPYGVVDPIADLGALAALRGIGFHVDACLGGYLLPFVERLPPGERAADVPAWDFRVPGVTSISADVHKYGYAAKGASTLLYRDMSWMRHQFTVEADWCGGVYVSPTLAGTRPGGPIAAAWAAMQALGARGYRDNARALMAVARTFRDGIASIPGLRVLGDPIGPVMAFTSAPDGPDILAVGDRMEAAGWHIDRVQNPAGLHVILNAGHAATAARWLADLADAAEHVRRHPELAGQGSAPMYGMIAKVPLRGMVRRNVLAFMERMYRPDAEGTDAPAGDGALPEAGDALPPWLQGAVDAWVRWRRGREG
ncbi:MAG TPA: aminotransferase class V-fold PLP-dependent enzyme [Myxococcota bacterium]|nr:aminotransferase class V-fold PLP-dependent enzyme [Myxococcota bacterium]